MYLVALLQYHFEFRQEQKINQPKPTTCCLNKQYADSIEDEELEGLLKDFQTSEKGLERMNKKMPITEPPEELTKKVEKQQEEEMRKITNEVDELFTEEYDQSCKNIEKLSPEKKP